MKNLDLIGKLPFILPAVMALFLGNLGLLADKSFDYICASMLVSIVIFGLIGYVVKAFLETSLKDNADEEETKDDSVNSIEAKEENKGTVIDLKVDDSKNPEVNNFYGDDFSPLEVSKVIKTSINNDK